MPGSALGTIVSYILMSVGGLFSVYHIGKLLWPLLQNMMGGSSQKVNVNVNTGTPSDISNGKKCSVEVWTKMTEIGFKVESLEKDITRLSDLTKDKTLSTDNANNQLYIQLGGITTTMKMLYDLLSKLSEE
jgi:hypothetical protein